MVASLFQASLFQDAIERSGWQVVTWLAGNRYPAGFDRVLELPVATAARDSIPAVVRQKLQNLSDFHHLEDSK